MPIEKPPAPGEHKHKLGEEGTRQAKLWLDSTTRVRHSYTNMDDGGPSRLAFMWPHGDQPYSYDLGGVFRGKPFENDTFVAESKNYVKAADQGTHFDKFLAQTYCTLAGYSRLAQHFMWITWAPFRSSTWDELHSSENILKALDHHREKIFGKDEGRPIADIVDMEIVSHMVENIWLIVLSKKQTKLVISQEDRFELSRIRDRREYENAN